MESIQILSLICSILGAFLFLYAIKVEFDIIKKLEKIKKSAQWKLITLLTGFFLLGYVVNIITILMEITTLREIFNALVFGFGAIFLLSVIMISNHTYSVIFEAAENEIGSDMELDD